MIRFEQVTLGALRAFSCEIPPGAVCRITTSSEDRKNELAATLFGTARPERGRIELFGADLYAVPVKERVRLFRRVGVVPEDGGLIGNLKVWENILLPAWYHLGTTAEQAEAGVVTIYEQLGFGRDYVKQLMGRLPDQLSIYEKRVVALIRAMLTNAEIMIYDFLFSGLDRDVAARLYRVTERFHAERPGRISLYLCADDAFAQRIKADLTVALDAEG